MLLDSIITDNKTVMVRTQIEQPVGGKGLAQISEWFHFKGRFSSCFGGGFGGGSGHRNQRHGGGNLVVVLIMMVKRRWF